MAARSITVHDGPRYLRAIDEIRAQLNLLA
jgi:hypothetical protein